MTTIIIDPVRQLPATQADVTFCATWVDAAYLGADSTYRYIETMRDSALANEAAVPLNTAARSAYRAQAAAYADALRVLDIAADAASRAVTREATR